MQKQNLIKLKSDSPNRYLMPSCKHRELVKLTA